MKRLCGEHHSGYLSPAFIRCLSQLPSDKKYVTWGLWGFIVFVLDGAGDVLVAGADAGGGDVETKVLARASFLGDDFERGVGHWRDISVE